MNIVPRKRFKRIASWFLIPLTHWYLSKDRKYKYKNIKIRVRPGVFHPGLFISTKLFLSYIESIDLLGKKVLELGSGTGLIAVFSALKGAYVTALDINPMAVKNSSENAELNKVKIKVLHSDLFDKLEPQKFDYILINPPYYPKNPQKIEEHAWFCGQDFNYFHILFNTLGSYINTDSEVMMSLSKGCDIAEIEKIAAERKFFLELKKEKKVLFDGSHYLFKVNPVPNT